MGSILYEVVFRRSGRMKLPQSHCKIIYNGFILNDIDNACENVRKILKSIEATVV